MLHVYLSYIHETHEAVTKKQHFLKGQVANVAGNHHGSHCQFLRCFEVRS